MNCRPLLLCIGLAQASLLFAASPAPADPSAPAPRVTYGSAFESYRGYREEPLADWRAVNDEAGRVGGHVGIFRGAGGRAGHGTAKPAAGKPATMQPQADAPAAAEGQPPVRGAPRAPAAAGH